MKGPVVILGPPGAGKSTAGPRAAEKLGMRFVDLDDEIARAANAPDVTRVFSDEGEISFRVRELSALDATLDGSDVLIAAGGGVVDTAPARQLLAQRALCVGMDVDVDTALARLLSHDVRRPWLMDASAARDAYMKRELARPPLRAQLCGADVVDARGAIDDVTERLASLVDALRPIRALPLDAIPGVAFVDTAHAALDRAREAAAAFGAGASRALVVVEDRVAQLHSVSGDVVVSGGERAKTMANVEDLARKLVAAGATRETTVVAVGGGALLDAVGLTAALLYRGVRWVSVPTTLLAQADAGLGGKTALDVDAKKNVLGAFHSPLLTIVARAFLSTLSEARLREGRAEMLKHEFLAADARADGSERTKAVLDDVLDVRRSLAIKASVVARDPRERGLRAVLNLGHTFAHALEAATATGTAPRPAARGPVGAPTSTSPPISHGEAVRHGLLRMLELSVKHAGLDTTAAKNMADRVRALGPMANIDGDVVDQAKLSEAMRADKKSGRWVLLRAPGLPIVTRLPSSQQLT